MAMRPFGRPARRARLARPQAPGGLAATAGCIEVAPKATDAAIQSWLEPHLIARDPNIPARNRLFLFLCGSFGTPARQQLITRFAAQLGYHAINLSYPNSWTVGGLCQDSLDPDCHGKVRLDVIDGGERSGLVRINPADSIEHRLRALLAERVRTAPDQGWERFITPAGDIDWSALVIAGHSQGGGHAAILGKRHAVARIIMLAAPVDYVRALHEHARWLSAPGATPPERYFGFVHSADQGLERIQRCWELLGLDRRPLISVDDHQPPYDGAQRLVTHIAQVPRHKFHGCVVQDRITPLRLDGTPVFEPVWRYLLDCHD